MLMLIRVVPSRYEMASRLSVALSEVAEAHQSGPVEIVSGQGDPERDFRLLIARLKVERGRVCVLEDDAWPCPNFIDRLDSLPAWADVIQLWSNRKADGELLQRGHGVYQRCASDFSGIVGTVLNPASVIAWEKAWLTWDRRRHPTAWDLCLAKACKVSGLSIGVAIPSLVQHLPVASSLGARSRRRQSRTYTEVYGLTPFEEEQLRLC